MAGNNEEDYDWLDFIGVGVKSFRSHRYCYDRGDDVCALCNTHFGTNEQTHEETLQHQRAVEEIVHFTYRIVRSRDNFRRLPKQLEKDLSPHGPWRGKIYEAIGREVMEDRSIRQDANELLLHYKKLEGISLLELAVWKFACLTSTDPKKDNQKRSFVEWSRWYASGWKEHKKSHYRCQQVVLLMKAIIPFLHDDKTTQGQRRRRYG